MAQNDHSMEAVDSDCEQIDHAVEQWRGMTSFKDLQQLMIKFIKGEIYANPWHGGPLDDESEVIQPALLALNETGFISLAGQPGLDAVGDYPNGRFHCQQKPFIEGLIHKNLLAKVLTDLLTQGYRVHVSGKDTFNMYSNTNMDLSARFWVTRSAPEGTDDFEEETWFPVFSTWILVEVIREFCTEEFYQVLENEYVVLGVCSMDIGPGSLEQDLLQAMQ